MDRATLLVGSLPYDDAHEAMTTALEEVGTSLRTLPDGETGERRDWILHIVESFRDHPDMEVASDGDWSDYDNLPRFRVRRGHTLYGASLDLGHVTPAVESLPTFRALREQYDRPDLSFQVGIPGDLDMALYALGPAGVLRHRRAFTEAALREIQRIHEVGGDDVVFQLEVPAELVFVAQANALGDRWPSGRPLEYVHAPFGAAEVPPSTDATFTAPLADLRLPTGTRFVAGLVQEAVDLDDQRAMLARVDRLIGGRVDVAAACGLGRRDRDGARDSLRQAAALCRD